METSDVLGAGAADASVRTATPGDLGAIGAVHARSWRAAYADSLPDDVLAALDPRELAQSWRGAVSDPPSAQHQVLVACSGPTVVGFAAVEPSGEMVSLLVDPTHQRRGHGSRLLSAAVDHLRSVGADEVSTWAPVTDPARRAFFASAGLGPDGTWRELEVPGAMAGLREVHLTAALADAGADAEPGAPRR